MGKSKKRDKSEKIGLLRQQYEAFLEEERKRRERNEYILRRLDTIRGAPAAPAAASATHGQHILRTRETNVFTEPQNISVQGFTPSIRAFISDSTNPVLPTQLPKNHMLVAKHVVEQPESNIEQTIIKEISKKYILIPKLLSQYNNENIKYNVNNQTDMRSPTENEWKNKYDILDRLNYIHDDENYDITRQYKHSIKEESCKIPFDILAEKHETNKTSHEPYMSQQIQAFNKDSFLSNDPKEVIPQLHKNVTMPANEFKINNHRVESTNNYDNNDEKGFCNNDNHPKNDKINSGKDFNQPRTCVVNEPNFQPSCEEKKTPQKCADYREESAQDEEQYANKMLINQIHSTYPKNPIEVLSDNNATKNVDHSLPQTTIPSLHADNQEGKKLDENQIAWNESGSKDLNQAASQKLVNNYAQVKKSQEQHREPNQNQPPVQYQENSQIITTGKNKNPYLSVASEQNPIQNIVNETHQIVPGEHELVKEQHGASDKMHGQQYEDHSFGVTQSYNDPHQVREEHYEDPNQTVQEYYEDPNLGVVQGQYNDPNQTAQEQYENPNQTMQGYYENPNQSVVKEQYNDPNQTQGHSEVFNETEQTQSMQGHYDDTKQIIKGQYDDPTSLAQGQQLSVVQGHYEDPIQNMEQSKYNNPNKVVQEYYEDPNQGIEQQGQYNNINQVAQEYHEDPNQSIVQGQYYDPSQAVQGQYEDPNHGIDQGPYHDPNQVLQGNYEDPNQSIAHGQYYDPAQVVQSQYEDPNHGIEQGPYDDPQQGHYEDQNQSIVHGQLNDSGQIVQSQYENPGQDIVQGQYNDLNQLVQGNYEDPTQAHYNDLNQVLQGHYEDPNQSIAHEQYNDPNQAVGYYPDLNQDAVQGQYNDPNQVVQGHYEDPNQIVQGHFEDPNGHTVQGENYNHNNTVLGNTENTNESIEKE